MTSVNLHLLPDLEIFSQVIFKTSSFLKACSFFTPSLFLLCCSELDNFYCSLFKFTISSGSFILLLGSYIVYFSYIFSTKIFIWFFFADSFFFIFSTIFIIDFWNTFTTTSLKYLSKNSRIFYILSVGLYLLSFIFNWHFSVISNFYYWIIMKLMKQFLWNCYEWCFIIFIIFMLWRFGCYLTLQFYAIGCDANLIEEMQTLPTVRYW